MKKCKIITVASGQPYEQMAEGFANSFRQLSWVSEVLVKKNALLPPKMDKCSFGEYIYIINDPTEMFAFIDCDTIAMPNCPMPEFETDMAATHVMPNSSLLAIHPYSNFKYENGSPVYINPTLLQFTTAVLFFKNAYFAKAFSMRWAEEYAKGACKTIDKIAAYTSITQLGFSLTILDPKYNDRINSNDAWIRHKK